MTQKRAIEEDFPIVEINRLAVPERNAFKPIYQMHKWFARRASCVFRAILLGAMKPAGTDIMAEFYKNHTHDPDTNGKIVLDPFMGGGTTVVEALRLGCRVIGIDLNPVAWFIVKTEVEPVDLDALDAAFDRLARRTVPWSGKPLRETLLDLYKTAPPWTAEEVCGLGESDIIYTFWVKSAICTSSTCRKQVPLFSDYVVAAKSPSIYYHPNCACPKCNEKFDWEIEPASLIADPRLMLHSTTYSGGGGRSTTRWTYAHPDGALYVCQGRGEKGQASVKWGMLGKGTVCCPHCDAIVTPMLPKGKKKRKKVPLTVLLCPRTEEVFQWRGELEPGVMVKSPGGHVFDPYAGNIPAKGKFLCPHCGRKDDIIKSIRSLPDDQLLPTSAYGMQVYAPACDLANDPAKRKEQEPDWFADAANNQDDAGDDEEAAIMNGSYSGPWVPPTHNLIWKQKGKYYVRHAPEDAARFQKAEQLWNQNKATLPYPKSEIPKGQETGRLLEHHFRSWHQMFNLRQLLALSTLLEAISGESDRANKEMFLSAFFSLLEGSNMFARYKKNQNKSESAKGVFSRHDFQPKVTPCEDHVWGLEYGKGFSPWFQIVRAGKVWGKNPNDSSYDQKGKLVRISDNSLAEATTCAVQEIDSTPRSTALHCGDSRGLTGVPLEGINLIITDPPYADNVNYAELADFFYVWLRLILKNNYPAFLPEFTPKQEEIVENKTRGVSAEDFGTGLMQVFAKGREKLAHDGLMVFTFHHAEGRAWESLLYAVMESGFEIEAIYPIHSDGETSLHLQGNEAIAYDLIHVCRKRRPEDVAKPRSWAGLRQEVRRRARAEVERIESGRYGNQPLPPPDVRMVLIGKCLEVYSRHYGAVLDWEGKPLPLREALQDIRVMVETVVSRESPLPAQLEEADALTQIWLLALCDKREVSVDHVSKLTRGVFEVGDLTGHKPPVLRKGRVKGGRTYEILTPLERSDGLKAILLKSEVAAPELPLDLPPSTPADGPPLLDVLHLLLAEAERGERLDHLAERFRGRSEAVQAALEYLKQRDPNRWAKACDKLLPYYSDLFARKLMAGESQEN